MKKPFIYGLFVVGALMFVRGIAHAQTTATLASSPATTTTQVIAGDLTASAGDTTSPSDDQTSSDSTAETSSSSTVTLSLKDRKDKIQVQLQTLDDSFKALVTRTQTSINLLSAKNIDTTNAQIHLDAARTALDLAKTNLDIFSAIVVPDDTTDYDVTPIKNALIAIKGNFTDARAHLVDSLAALKTSIAATLETTSTDSQD